MSDSKSAIYNGFRERMSGESEAHHGSLKARHEAEQLERYHNECDARMAKESHIIRFLRSFNEH